MWHNQQQIAQRYAAIIESMTQESKFMYVGSLLERAVRIFPNNQALICKSVSMTYQDVYYRAQQVKAQLQALGVKSGDRVCIWVENSLEFYAAYYGVWHAGAIVVPLNTFLHEKEFDHIIKDATPSAIIMGRIFVERLKTIDMAGLPPILWDDQIDMTTEIAGPIKIDTVPYRAPDELAALLYTSGTTGFPKGVMLSSRNILTNVAQAISQVEVTDKDRLYGMLPLFHSFAQNLCVWSSFYVGATTIVVPKVERKWILEGLVHKPTAIAAVPALFGLLCLMKNAPLDSVRYFISGGDALPDKIRGAFSMIYRRKICNGYGLTEASPFIAAHLNDELVQTNTIGYPAPGILCSLRDEAGNEVSPGQIGILWVKGNNIMMGYYNAPEHTAQVLQDGWLNTGDFASFDDKGRLLIVGRHKDLIIHKGFNIYPQEIENVLMMHSAVFKSAVVGFADADVGEIVIGFVACKEGQTDVEKQLKILCAENLASYKIPRNFIILEDLPMTALGKIDKKKLRAEYADKV